MRPRLLKLMNNHKLISVLTSVTLLVSGAFLIHCCGALETTAKAENRNVASIAEYSNVDNNVAHETIYHKDNTISTNNSNNVADKNSSAENSSALASVETVDELGISGTSAMMIEAGKPYSFLNGIGTIPTKQDWTDGTEYRVIVTGVTGEKGCTYIYKNGDTSFTPSKNDDGKKYTIKYILQTRKNGGTWSNCNVTATKELTVYAVNETKDELGNDEAYIKSSSITDVIDGSGPWDADNAAGNDSSDHNKIVRTWDIATYNVSYTTSVYENGTSYKNGYVNFRFTIPFSEEQVAFDTDSMGWMSTDPQHMWSVSKTSLGGKTVQTLSCSKRLTSQSGNESAIPGSGETYSYAS